MLYFERDMEFGAWKMISLIVIEEVFASWAENRLEQVVSTCRTQSNTLCSCCKVIKRLSG